MANEYASAVGQRNAALRRIRAGQSTRDALAPWTERVVALGDELVVARAETVGLLAGAFAELSGSFGLADAALAYEGAAPTVAELESRLAADIERGITGAGPHLHDLRIEAGGRDLRVYGSQGEQRVAVLSLVLAEAELLRERLDVSPLVLLDDVLSELDGSRRAVLAEVITRTAQTVVTATSPEALPSEPALRSRSHRVEWADGAPRRSGPERASHGAAVETPSHSPSSPPPGPRSSATRSRGTRGRSAIARDGTLHVAAASATWAHELDLLQETILEGLKGRLGDAAPARAAIRRRADPGAADAERAARGGPCRDPSRSLRRSPRKRPQRPPRSTTRSSASSLREPLARAC